MGAVWLLTAETLPGVRDLEAHNLVLVLDLYQPCLAHLCDRTNIFWVPWLGTHWAVFFNNLGLHTLKESFQ